MSIKKLYVFDFDNTMFRSPEDTEKNKKLYQEQTGLPWNISREQAATLSRRLKRPVHSRSGWWGKKESLLPPLVPDPVPTELWIEETLQSLQEAMQDADGLTLIMTGRHLGMLQEVLRVMSHAPFLKVQRSEKKTESHRSWEPDDTHRWDVHRYHYSWSHPTIELKVLGMDGPCPDIVGRKPNTTFEWKVWIIQQYRVLHPFLEEIEFWEDRSEHVEKFRSLQSEFKEKVIVNHVK